MVFLFCFLNLNPNFFHCLLLYSTITLVLALYQYLWGPYKRATVNHGRSLRVACPLRVSPRRSTCETPDHLPTLRPDVSGHISLKGSLCRIDCNLTSTRYFKSIPKLYLHTGLCLVEREPP